MISSSYPNFLYSIFYIIKILFINLENIILLWGWGWGWGWGWAQPPPQPQPQPQDKIICLRFINFFLIINKMEYKKLG